MNCKTLLMILLLMCCCGNDICGNSNPDNGMDCACKAALLLSLGALSAGCLCPGEMLSQDDLVPPPPSEIIV